MKMLPKPKENKRNTEENKKKQVQFQNKQK